jgi:hypothetical protein
MANKRRPRRRVAPPTPDKKTALGIIAGEGYTTCTERTVKIKGKTYRYVHPRIAVRMCDPVAIQKVADLFRTSVIPIKGLRCPPTIDNPEGRIYGTEVEGKKAIEIINRPELAGTEIRRKAKQKKCFHPK